MTTKSMNPFQSKGWNYLDKLGESSYMPHYYEDDMNNEPVTTPSFRSLSPKIYNHHQKIDYFTDFEQQDDYDELQDDCDGLYEAMLMNSNFLSNISSTVEEESSTEKPTNTTSVNRLTQILNHLNPYKHHSALSEVLSSTPSIRSQFSTSSSSASQSQQPKPVIPMVAFSMPDPRDTKGKGKFKPNI